MTPYHKIDTCYKRDLATNHKTLVEGDWAQDAFGYLANNEWVFTEKVDGTNIRIMCGPQEGTTYGIKFGGKTDAAQIPATLVDRLRERFLSQEERIREILPEGGCLYGEGYGAKIQKGGGNYRSDQDFVLFDVRIGEFWLERSNVEDIANKLGLDVVPILQRGTLHQMVDMARTGFKSTWSSYSTIFMAEGIVARPAVELKTRSGSRIITKIKHKDFVRPA